MRPVLRWMPLVVVGIAVCAGSLTAEAAEPEISVTLAPVRYIAVDGDSSTFREHHWMNDGYTSGIANYSSTYEFADGTHFTMDGHALPQQNDLGTSLLLRNEDLGFVNLDFKEFRKYYSNKAGVHYRFNSLQAPDTDRGLALDIGKLELEVGLATREGLPEVTFLYEHEHKDGVKSRLSWAEVEDNRGATGTTRNIAPSWQEIDEKVDVYGLELEHELAGFALSGEQRWEFVRSENVRQELDLATTGSADDNRLRLQDQAPESTLMTSLLGAERSFQDGRVFFATAYRFSHMNNREFETILEYEAGVETGSERKLNARADNSYAAHTWVGNSAVKLTEALTLTTKLKAEAISRDSNSTYPADTTVGGAIDEVERGVSDSKVARVAEGLSLRYTGIPRTALYNEVELEQGRLLLRETQTNMLVPATSYARETVNRTRRGTWALGGNVAPWAFLDLTAQVRRRVNNDDPDDQRENTTNISSAFIDRQSVHTDEFMTRATYKPCRWARSSLRYTYRDDDYSVAVQSQQLTKTGMLSHIYIYDVSLQPVQDLLMTGSFSRQTSATKTPARYGSSGSNIPTFNANVNTWFFSAEYAAKQELVVTGSLQHSRAKNFNDFTLIGNPYGADYAQTDVTTGLTWTPEEDTSVGVEYGFYSYQPNSNWSAADYNAHLISLEVSKAF